VAGNAHITATAEGGWLIAADSCSARESHAFALQFGLDIDNGDPLRNLSRGQRLTEILNPTRINYARRDRRKAGRMMIYAGYQLGFSRWLWKLQMPAHAQQMVYRITRGQLFRGPRTKSTNTQAFDDETTKGHVFLFPPTTSSSPIQGKVQGQSGDRRRSPCHVF